MQLAETPDFRPEIIIAECNGFIRPDLKAILGDDLARDNMQQSLLVFRSLFLRPYPGFLSCPNPTLSVFL
jgi:hypothetical protein